ncbi:ZIP family metal transporter [Candidatus Woesearchaeota archaeon]|nr:ZIP family metal transporter [Candidatus Woesearchaeota archaeon]
MNEVWVYTLASVLIVSVISLIGVFTLAIDIKRLRKILLYMVSFSAGAMFGDAFLHLLPEASSQGLGLSASFSIIIGIAFSFVVEMLIHWRHCHLPTTKKHPHPFAYLNLFGDGVHNFIDGIIIGAGYLLSIPAGIATTLAVVLHEIPQEIGDFGILIHGGFSKNKALFFNFLTALTSFLGAVVSLLLGSKIENATAFLVPFAAGTFIYIAGSDLIPELHKEINIGKSLLQFGTFCAGVLVMLALLVIG